MVNKIVTGLAVFLIACGLVSFIARQESPGQWTAKPTTESQVDLQSDISTLMKSRAIKKAYAKIDDSSEYYLAVVLRTRISDGPVRGFGKRWEAEVMTTDGKIQLIGGRLKPSMRNEQVLPARVIAVRQNELIILGPSDIIVLSTYKALKFEKASPSPRRSSTTTTTTKAG